MDRADYGDGKWRERVLPLLRTELAQRGWIPLLRKGRFVKAGDALDCIHARSDRMYTNVG